MQKVTGTRGRKQRRGKNKFGFGKAASTFVDIVESATYAEHNYFSERNPMWRRFRTKAPRLPTDADRETQWTRTLFQPPLLSMFFGTHNKKVCLMMMYVSERVSDSLSMFTF
jgi:hypothetical protein